MQEDFHYYATYAAAYLAGYSHEECLAISYSDQFTDICSRTFLSKVKGPSSAATTQLQLELANASTDAAGIHDITRIWSSFHFLPYDLNAKVEKGSRKYKNKYRLICNSNGELVAKTVELAKGKSLQSVGIAMHVLADTWAHKYFAGTPSLVINNTNYHFYELFPENDGFSEKKIEFFHSISTPDKLEKSSYTCSIYSGDELSIMNLGHGRAGHLPDYSFIRYKYLPAWGDYEEIIKDNPADYYNAFCQMVYAMKYIRGAGKSFETGVYDTEAVKDIESEIRHIIEKRQVLASDDWKALGEKLSGETIIPFEMDRYTNEYINASADEKDDTFLGKYFTAALAQKSMVTNSIYKSGNNLAGISVDYESSGFKGIKDFFKLIKFSNEGEDND